MHAICSCTMSAIQVGVRQKCGPNLDSGQSVPLTRQMAGCSFKVLKQYLGCLDHAFEHHWGSNLFASLLLKVIFLYLLFSLCLFITVILIYLFKLSHFGLFQFLIWSYSMQVTVMMEVNVEEGWHNFDLT